MNTFFNVGRPFARCRIDGHHFTTARRGYAARETLAAVWIIDGEGRLVRRWSRAFGTSMRESGGRAPSPIVGIGPGTDGRHATL